ncbi:MAG: 1,2-phenylacetyl-CoA epoxidase subunit PaaD [Saprospiraceae bacterium]
MTKSEIFDILASVTDPEIPVVTIQDLGILQDIEVAKDGHSVKVFITPTYNGCPAMDMITVNIKAALQEHHIYDVEVISLIEPIWTTDWITEAGRQKLMDYGISPPAQKTTDTSFISGEMPRVQCPQCKSFDTELISRFGSTACKSLYKCHECLEPFDYFKCH